MDKLDALEEFRKEEFFELLNKQYANVQLQEPKEVRENSIVLIRNIGNEPKREPLKIARVEKIHPSRDDAQRVVTLTYNNVRVNKDGEWVGTPIRVERSVNDLVIVDNALNDSMLSPKIGKENQKNKKDEKENLSDHGDKEDATKNKERSNDTEILEEIDDHVEEATENEGINVRRSTRTKKKRMVITEDEIGDCDNIDDPDYNINQRRQ